MKRKVNRKRKKKLKRKLNKKRKGKKALIKKKVDNNKMKDRK